MSDCGTIDSFLARSSSLPLPGLDRAKNNTLKEGDAPGFAALCIECGIDEGLAQLRDHWEKTKHPLPAAIRPLVSNPDYLSAWSMAVALKGGTDAISGAVDRECTSLAFAAGITCLTLLDGATAWTGVERYLSRAKTLRSSLNELAKALSRDSTLNPFELAKVKAECAQQIRSALALPEIKEVFTIVVADGVNALHVAAHHFLTIAQTVGIQQVAQELALNTGEQGFLQARELTDLGKLFQKANGNPSPQFLGHFDEQQQNLVEKKDWFTENLFFGAAMNLTGFARGVLETMRLSDVRAFLIELRDGLAQGIEQLKNKPGAKILTHLFHSVLHRINANVAALVGSGTRMFNGVGAFIIKALGLAGVATGPAGTVLGSVVIAIYAIKIYVQMHYERLARHNENEVFNAFKMAENISSEELQLAIAKDLVEDLEALSGDLENIKAFVEAMGGRPEVFEAFSARFQQTTHKKERLRLLRSLVDACMPLSEARTIQEMVKHQDAAVQLVGHALAAEAKATPAIPKKAGKPVYPPVLPSSTLKNKATRWEAKCFRNLPDKAIACLSGSDPGWNLSPDFSVQLSIKAETHLTQTCGDTPATRDLIAIARALNRNKALVKNYNVFQFFLKARTWELTPEGKDVQQALAGGHTRLLSTTTLAAALSKTDADLNNHHTLAGCRFDADTKAGAEERAHLATRLATVRTNKTHTPFKLIVEATEACDGKKLLALGQKMSKTAEGARQFQHDFETAWMLAEHPQAQAVAVYQALFAAEPPATADDVGQALAILSGKQLHARIGNDPLRNAVQQLLTTDENATITASRDTLFVKSGVDEPRWDLFADDVIAGKNTLANAPDWLLGEDIRELLQGRKLDKACGPALRQQLQFGLIGQQKKEMQEKQAQALPPRQPLSLLWPTTVLGKNTAALAERWKDAFHALCGINAGACSWPELKAAATLYARRLQPRTFSLGEFEKLVRQHRAHPNAGWPLPLTLALRWVAAASPIPFDAETVLENLKKSDNSKDFIDILVKLIKPDLDATRVGVDQKKPRPPRPKPKDDAEIRYFPPAAHRAHRLWSNVISQGQRGPLRRIGGDAGQPGPLDSEPLHITQGQRSPLRHIGGDAHQPGPLDDDDEPSQHDSTALLRHQSDIARHQHQRRASV